MHNSHSPCVMTDTEQFYVRFCPCGVVHLAFGPSVVNLSVAAFFSVTESLQSLSAEMRERMKQVQSNVVQINSSAMATKMRD